MHTITILFALGTSFICLSLSMFNNSTLWCWVNAYPIGCSQSYANDGFTDCTRGDNAEIYRWAFFFGPLWLCVLLCMIIMFMIFYGIRKQENKLKKYQFTANRRRNSSVNWDDGVEQEDQQRKKDDDKRRHQQSRQVAHQALRFVGVFYLTWTFATLNRILQINGTSTFWLMCLHTIFVPMQG